MIGAPSLDARSGAVPAGSGAAPAARVAGPEGALVASPSEASTMCCPTSVTCLRIRCEGQCPLPSTNPVNQDKPFERRICKSCASTDRGLQRMWKAKKALKSDWQKKTPEQKVAILTSEFLDSQSV